VQTGPAPRRVLIDGGPLPHILKDNLDSVETTLDVETIAGNAPGTALYVYEFPNFDSNQYVIDSYNKIVDDNIVDTANSSFGGCELALGPSVVKTFDAIAMQGAAKGITFHAASGDVPSACTNAPASGTHFVAVGGTELGISARGEWLEELAWQGSEGGVSSVFPLPAWQHHVPNILLGGRNVPDVAFDADSSTGTAFYYDGYAPTGCSAGWNICYDPLGGTSLASPLFGAAIVEVDELLGGRTGLVAPMLYAAFKAHGYAWDGDVLFHDISVGGNGLYDALPGYDQVTGIGSMDVYDLFHDGAFKK
jgi:subtilase family serine protease